MAAKILSVVFTAASAALVKTAFDAWAAGGYVVCSSVMIANDAQNSFVMIVLYYA